MPSSSPPWSDRPGASSRPPDGTITLSPEARGAEPIAVPLPRPPHPKDAHIVPPGQAPAVPGGEAHLVPAAAELPDDVTDLVFGLLAVGIELSRSAVTATSRLPRAVYDRLPLPAAVRRRASRARLALADRGQVERSAVVHWLNDVTDVVVPRAVPVVLSRLDVASIVRDYVDIDRIAALLDVDAVVARVDMDAVLARLDLDEIAGRLDLNELVARVDITAIIDRVDIEAIVEGIDLDRIVDRVDIDRAAARLDLDPVIDRADLLGLARYIVDGIDLVSIIRSSMESITSETVRGVRTQSADADQAVERVVDRLLLRRRSRRTDAAPPQADGDHDRG